MEAGSRKGRKKHKEEADKNDMWLVLLILVLNTYQQDFLYLKVAIKMV